MIAWRCIPPRIEYYVFDFARRSRTGVRSGSPMISIGTPNGAMSSDRFRMPATGYGPPSASHCPLCALFVLKCNSGAL